MIYAALVIVIIALVVERYFTLKAMNAQVNDCLKAIMSKNTQDFIQMKAIDKVEVTAPKEPEFIPEDRLSDDQFDKLIQKTNGR